MAKDVWINLPVRDVDKARDFFRAIGFNLNHQHNTDTMAAMSYGNDKTMIMLFRQDVLEQFTGSPVPTDKSTASFIISFGADTRAEVDETALRVKNAGGKLFAEPAEKDGWMYGFGFTDHDGHRWNMLYMEPQTK